jgi:hypothetical protein
MPNGMHTPPLQHVEQLEDEHAVAPLELDDDAEPPPVPGKPLVLEDEAAVELEEAEDDAEALPPVPPAEPELDAVEELEDAAVEDELLEELEEPPPDELLLDEEVTGETHTSPEHVPLQHSENARHASPSAWHVAPLDDELALLVSIVFTSLVTGAKSGA